MTLRTIDRPLGITPITAVIVDAGKIRRGRYKVKGKFYGKPAIRFVAGPKILRPKRGDD